jgi:hypothetical protein
MKAGLFFFFLMSALFAKFEDHYRKIEKKTGCRAPRNIDYVYMINLDERPERWIQSMQQLAPLGIIPLRVPGIYGWSLKPDELNDMGVKFQPGMWTGKEAVMVFPPEKNGYWDFVDLGNAPYGTACFSGWTVKGTIGCSLAHLSVLKDAYDSGYETVWVMEDDIFLEDDPHLVSSLIEELDLLTAPDGWDVLYTDFDRLVVNPNQSLESQIPLMWRPDMPFRDISFLAHHVPLGEKFMKIGSRMRAHSIIYRRSGLEKIIGFYREHDNFLPYDQELALIPDIQIYVVMKSVVSYREKTSDTRLWHFQHN